MINPQKKELHDGRIIFIFIVKYFCEDDMYIYIHMYIVPLIYALCRLIITHAAKFVFFVALNKLVFYRDRSNTLSVLTGIIIHTILRFSFIGRFSLKIIESVDNHA